MGTTFFEFRCECKMCRNGGACEAACLAWEAAEEEDRENAARAEMEDE